MLEVIDLAGKLIPGHGKGLFLLTEEGGQGFLDMNGGAISDGLNHGLRVESCAGCRVHHSSVERIALLAGMGKNDNGNYNGVKFGGAGAVLEYNRISQTGYLGLDIRGPATVRHNLIDGFNLVKTDGAGIYTWSPLGLRVLRRVSLVAGQR